MKAGADETDLHTRESLSASLLTPSDRENPSTNPSTSSDPANPSTLPTSNPPPHPNAHTSHPPSTSPHASYDPHSRHPTFQHHTGQASSAHEQPHYSAPPSPAAAPPSTAYTGDQFLPPHPSHNRATTWSPWTIAARSRRPTSGGARGGHSPGRRRRTWAQFLRRENASEVASVVVRDPDRRYGLGCRAIGSARGCDRGTWSGCATVGR